VIYWQFNNLVWPPIIVPNSIIFAGEEEDLENQAPDNEPICWGYRGTPGTPSFQYNSHGAAVMSVIGSGDFGVVNKARIQGVKVSNGYRPLGTSQFVDKGVSVKALHYGFLQAITDAFTFRNGRDGRGVFFVCSIRKFTTSGFINLVYSSRAEMPRCLREKSRENQALPDNIFVVCGHCTSLHSEETHFY
jgi:hypothetical protein